MLCYFLPVLGAWLADSLIGKFRTILYLSLVYILGLLVLTLAAMPPVPFNAIAGTMSGLLLIAIGTGGIKPCVSTYGADQFKPGQEHHRERFFAYFYFCINAGSLISTFVTPILRSDVQCFGEKTCYSLAFGVPAALMAVALILFLLGKPFYTDTPVFGSLISRVFCCVCHAIVNNVKGRTGAKGPKPSITSEMSTSSDAAMIPSNHLSQSPKSKLMSIWKGKRRVSTTHWLDAAADKYDAEFIADVKQLLHVLFMFLPIPMFWALFDQQGSRWTLQANKMDGRITDTYYFQPDQVQIFNPVLILIFIPCFETVIYPVMHKLKIPFRLLARMVVGMVLAGVAFVIAGFLQVAIDKTLPTVPAADRSEMRIFNPNACSLSLSGDVFPNASDHIGPHSMLVVPPFPVNSQKEIWLTVSTINCSTQSSIKAPITVSGGTGYFAFLGMQNGQLTVQQIEGKHVKPEDSNSKVLFVLPFALNTTSGAGNITLINPGIAEDKEGHEIIVPVNSTTNGSDYGSHTITTVAADVDQGPYVIYLSDQRSHFGAAPMGTKQIDFPIGGYYVVLLKDLGSAALTNASESWERYTIIQPNSISIFWQFPQYFVITLAEVFLSVSGLSFAYSEAPESMRSVMQAAWLLTSAFGSVIVMIFSGGHLIASQAVEFFVFAGLIGIFAIIFAIMSHFYHYVKPNVTAVAVEMMDRNDDDALHKKDDSYLAKEINT
ncbi:solute carrier family 15 member 1-like isoform X2 [Paramacrobiotus metropolitanus]|nr:solute carrier family 15 member 1-like isoform X2 [Paramacrobiotus metropolitanus]